VADVFTCATLRAELPGALLEERLAGGESQPSFRFSGAGRRTVDVHARLTITDLTRCRSCWPAGVGVDRLEGGGVVDVDWVRENHQDRVALNLVGRGLVIEGPGGIHLAPDQPVMAEVAARWDSQRGLLMVDRAVAAAGSVHVDAVGSIPAQTGGAWRHWIQD